MQFTIKKKIAARGVGIHGNKVANLTLKPADVDTGIVFIRTDVKDKNNIIPAHFSNISTTLLSTKLANQDGICVSTVEHIMAAFSAFNITNVIVEIDSIEIPIMEGGSADFCFMLECAGVQSQTKKTKHIKLLKKIQVGHEDSYIIAKPSDEFQIEFISNFKSKAIGEQSFKYDAKTDFMTEISSARTIANFDDVATLQSAGLGLGGNLNNTLVFNKQDVLNETCSFNNDDFIKHKILDFIGDIYLSGGHIIADFKCFKSGHKLNHSLMKEIFSDTNNYTFI